MALNGINRPLLQTGQEAVWLRVWQSYGMSADQVRAYFSGPAHLPWHRMANLDRWGGPLPVSYIEGQQKLQRKILSRARELGMRPILSAFAGHVPLELTKLRPKAKITRIKPGWGGLSAEYGTWYLDPTDPLFAEIQEKFINAQTATYGTDHLYAADPFNEMEPPSWEPAYLSTVSKAIWQGMVSADAQARWYQMAWTFNYDKHWSEERLSALFEPVPRDRMVLLDYAGEEVELYRRTKDFYGRPFIWNYLGNFGGRTHLLAPLDSASENIAQALKLTNCIGVGSTLEGLNVNQVIYEMLFEQPWRPSGSLQVSEWIKDYAIRRAGRAEPAVIEAWELLATKILNSRSVKADNGSIFQVYPSFKGKDGWTRPNIAYAPEDLIRALEITLRASASCRASDAYAFDVVNLTRQVLCNHGLDVYRRIIAAYTQKDVAAFERESSAFIEVGRDVDYLLGTRHEFLLGPWLASARQCGRSPAEADYYELNAREIITCWHQASNGLRDYASRQWNGLLRTYYLPRWEKFIEIAAQSVEQNIAFPEQPFATWAKDAATRWVQARGEVYLLEPQEDSVGMAERLFHKYRKHEE
jgi:alpha-N-acetylglucosaminidase